MPLPVLDFPASPTLDQRHPDPVVTGQPQYRWDGQVWLATVADEDMRGSIYAAPLDALAYNGMQINGSMEVSQEKGTAITTTNTYVIDGWQLAKLGTSAVRAAQFSLYQFDGLPNYVGLEVTTAQPSMTASDIVFLNTVIEGYRIRRLAWGTANAQPITIGFWSRHVRTGTYSVAIQNAAGSHSYVATYTQLASDTPEYKTITIPPPPPGIVWLTDNSLGMYVVFVVASGTAPTTPVNNSWQAGNYKAAIGQVNGVATTSDVFKFTGVVVLPGIEAPSAERSALIMRPFDQELVTCQRYFFILTSIIIDSAGASQTTVYPGPMRAVPTITAYNAGTPVTVNLVAPTTKSVQIYQTTRSYLDVFFDARL